MSVFRKGKVSVGSDGGKFIKLEADKPLGLILLQGMSEFISFDQHAMWHDEGKSPMFPCIGKGCPGCAMGDKPRFRGVMPVIEKGDASKTIKIWTFGKMVAVALQEIEEVSGSVAGLLVSVKRTGAGLKTRYSVTSTGSRFNISAIVANLPDITKELGPTSVAEIKKLISGEEAEVDDSELVEEVSEPEPAKKTKATKKSTGHKPVEEEVAEDTSSPFEELPVDESEVDSLL
jgi:hypothetical protein